MKVSPAEARRNLWKLKAYLAATFGFQPSEIGRLTSTRFLRWTREASRVNEERAKALNGDE